jgi:hypothetical protein
MKNIKILKKEGERETVIEGMNVIDVHYMHV